MAVRRAHHATEQRRITAPRARLSLGPRVLALADGAAFGVLLVALIAVPSIFAVESRDAFVMPKVVVAVGLAALLVPLLVIRWLATSWTLSEIRRTPLVWLLAAYVLLNVVAAWFAIDRQHALFGERLQHQGLVVTLAYAVYLVAGWTTIRSEQRRTRLLWSVAVGAAVVATYALLQRVHLDPIWEGRTDDRVFSTFGQPNWLAALFVMSAPLTVALAAGRPLVAQLALAILAVAQLAALAFTLSRGGFLGAGVATLVLIAVVVAHRRLALTARGLLVSVLALAVLVAGVLAIPDTRRGIDDVVERVGMIDDVDEPSASAHLDQWAVGVAIAADHWLIGAGQDSYVLLFGDYRDEVLPEHRAKIWRKYRPESPHNHVLAIAGGAGAPALLAYLGIIGAAAARGIGGVRRAVDGRTVIIGGAFLAAVAGHLVTDSFVTAEVSTSMLFWVVLGACAALRGGDAGQRRSGEPLINE